MADVLGFEVTVAPVVDKDVVERELTLVVNGGEPVVSRFPGNATDLGAVTVPQGASVVLSLVDVDDAGNRSLPATLEFVAEDTLPPSQPGGLAVTLVHETHVEDAPEAPTDET